MMPEFEWDANKSASNLAKHGLSFEDVIAVWRDPFAITAPGNPGLEERFMTIGRIEGKTWAAIDTIRDGRIRLISVRRTRFDETAAYEGAIYSATRIV